MSRRFKMRQNFSGDCGSVNVVLDDSFWFHRAHSQGIPTGVRNAAQQVNLIRNGRASWIKHPLLDTCRAGASSDGTIWPNIQVQSYIASQYSG